MLENINNYNLKLQQKFKKINLILNIFLEKQLFYFIYLYLFFLQRICITFTSNQFFNIFNNFLVKFCNIFHFSLLVNNLNILNRVYFINQSKIALLSIIIKNKKKLSKFKSKFKFINLNKKVPILEFKNFYFNKFFKYGKKIHSGSFLNKRSVYYLNEKFIDFSFTMIRLFKFKVIFSIFFRLRIQFNKYLRYISFLGLRRFHSSNIASKFFFKRTLKFARKIKYFNGKFYNKVKFIITLSNLSSRLLNYGSMLRGSKYFISKISDKFCMGKKMYILTTGRCVIFRFSEKLGIPLPFKYTKYKKLKAKIIEMKFNRIFNFRFLRKFHKLYKNKLILKSEYIKNFKSTNYFIKKPIQKLIISGRKKLGFNIYNNLFLSLNKIFKRPALEHIEIVNNVYKKLFIRATVKNIERNRSALGVRQSCSLLMGFEELKSRVNLFFYDYINSLCRKKTKIVRIRKVKDLIFSDFFKFSLRNNLIKQSSHLAVVYADIYTFMFTELKFRGAFRPFRARILEIGKVRRKFKRNYKKIKNYFKFRFKKNLKNIRIFRKLQKKFLKHPRFSYNKLSILEYYKSFNREVYDIKLKKEHPYFYQFLNTKTRNKKYSYNISKLVRDLIIITQVKSKFKKRNINKIKLSSIIFKLIVRKFNNNLKNKYRKILTRYILLPYKYKSLVLKFIRNRKFKQNNIKLFNDKFRHLYNKLKYKLIKKLNIYKKKKKIIKLNFIYYFLLRKYKLKKKEFNYDKLDKLKYIYYVISFKNFFNKKLKNFKNFISKKKRISNIKKKLKYKFRLKFLFKKLFHKLHFNMKILYREKRAKKIAKKFKTIVRRRKIKKKIKLKINRKLKNINKPFEYKHTNKNQFRYFKYFIKIKKKKIKKIRRSKKNHIKFKKTLWRFKRIMKLKQRLVYKKKKNAIISYIRKYLKIKFFIYSADLLTKGVSNSITKKNRRFMYKSKKFLNKFFIYRRIGNFIYPKNKSRFEILKIYRNLGAERTSHLLRACYLFKNKVLLIKKNKDIKYSAKKFINKFLFFSFKSIKKIRYIFSNLSNKYTKRYFKIIRLIFRKHKFLKFFFYKNLNNIFLVNSLNIYRMILKNKYLTKLYKYLKNFYKKFLKYFKINYNNILNYNI